MDILPIGNKYQKKLRWNSNYKTVDISIILIGKISKNL